MDLEDVDLPEGVVSRRKLAELTAERDFERECMAEEFLVRKRKQQEMEEEKLRKEKKQKKKEKKLLKKQKKEEKKKKKKEKKKAASKGKSKSDSSESSNSDSSDSGDGKESDDDGEWVEVGASSLSKADVNEENKSTAKREGWMLLPMTSTRESATPKRSEPQQENIETDTKATPSTEQKAEMPPPTNTTPVVPRKIGDGGATWRNRALLRAKEMAQESGRALEDVLMERYGNLDLLSIESDSRARNSPSTPRTETPRDRGTSMRDTPSSSKTMMRSPDVGRDLRWRKSTGSINTPVQDRSDAGNDEAGPDQSVAKTPVRRSHDSDLPVIAPSSAQQIVEIRTKDLSTSTPEFPFPDITDFNTLHAKAMKAQMKGDQQLFEAINRQIEHLKENPVTVKKVIVLPQVDQDGKLLSQSIHGEKQHKHQKRANMYDKDGNRTAFFNDDNVTLDELRSREKKEGILDQDLAAAENIARNARYKGKEFDEDYEYDQDMSAYEDHRKRQSRDKQESRQKNRMIKEYKIEQEIQDNCWFCFDSAKRQKQLALSFGEKVYLAIPDRGILHPYQCLIVPMNHIHSSIAADEEVYAEIQRFKQSLVQMMKSLGYGIIFIETNTNHKRRRHMFIECIPLPKDLAMDAPLYYRKAIMESDEEWSQNKKLIDTSKKGLRWSIPKEFPYFHVEFGSGGGFGHVIEDEEKFPHYYGKSIVGSMLDCEPNRWLKPRKENPDYLLDIRKKFLADWQKFDWTVELDGGEYMEEAS
eukprot:TRINITY_DN4157_c0_g1_i5.p1 TRINITY_DN4157_c0_g1~~TRINITY_DN4157_c0_g1_i5.p1  ORF type:complete len:757 (-),score=210.76 TRINITY_DN4157_c0_g1_i5:246-2516(-)